MIRRLLQEVITLCSWLFHLTICFLFVDQPRSLNDCLVLCFFRINEDGSTKEDRNYEMSVLRLPMNT